jgi:hypothetical protein
MPGEPSEEVAEPACGEVDEPEPAPLLRRDGSASPGRGGAVGSVAQPLDAHTVEDVARAWAEGAKTGSGFCTCICGRRGESSARCCC